MVKPLGAATAFPVQFDNSAVRKRFGSSWAKKILMVAVAISIRHITAENYPAPTKETSELSTVLGTAKLP
jgi:hypothetical protein